MPTRDSYKSLCWWTRPDIILSFWGYKDILVIPPVWQNTRNIKPNVQRLFFGYFEFKLKKTPKSGEPTTITGDYTPHGNVIWDQMVRQDKWLFTKGSVKILCTYTLLVIRIRRERGRGFISKTTKDKGVNTLIYLG